MTKLAVPRGCGLTLGRRAGRGGPLRKLIKRKPYPYLFRAARAWEQERGPKSFLRVGTFGLHGCECGLRWGPSLRRGTYHLYGSYSLTAYIIIEPCPRTHQNKPPWLGVSRGTVIANIGLFFFSFLSSLTSQVIPT